MDVSISDISTSSLPEGTEITVKGWVRTRRDSKSGVSFIHLSDGSCFNSLQIVVPDEISNYQSEVIKVTAGCSIIARGCLVQSKGSGQSVELRAREVHVVGWVKDPETYPMSSKRHSMEYLREHAHLRPRTNIIGSMTRVRNCISQAIHRFFNEQGFLWVSTPIITASDCEGAGEMFRVSTLDPNNIPLDSNGHVDFKEDFFGKETFLTVSGQLNTETYACALSKVYTFGPTFRAENSNTSRHLAEFWMVEPEIAFADLEQSAQLAESLLKYICKAVLIERQDDMSFFVKHIDSNAISRLERLINMDFITVDYAEAVDILIDSGKKFEFPVYWGVDLSSEHERYLTEIHFNSPVIVINYPKEIKAFYMKVNDDGKTVAAMDVLAPGIGEIIGGSQREHRIDVLDERIVEAGMNPKDYGWYRELRTYGTVPHSGFGLGLERMVAYVTGISNVRDVIPFPRTPKNASF
ncbi:asparagine--tRNA ligase [Oceanisphaera psychrotolerans]|uniref:Asparagine--tRNA ligase n=1 Tax=Oceanisphaera psychrotolerans TaxID=1414654 RepID=A0A1J4QAH6_9GAMM|nr:asparagine--tRNA ligase [Oceanisphaera psychrotolerans]OIN06586.1 asparagine--tRNA ligase [Oceanisphaera psychrotolerans]